MDLPQSDQKVMFVLFAAKEAVLDKYLGSLQLDTIKQQRTDDSKVNQFLHLLKQSYKKFQLDGGKEVKFKELLSAMKRAKIQLDESTSTDRIIQLLFNRLAASHRELRNVKDRITVKVKNTQFKIVEDKSCISVLSSHSSMYVCLQDALLQQNVVEGGQDVLFISFEKPSPNLKLQLKFNLSCFSEARSKIRATQVGIKEELLQKLKRLEQEKDSIQKPKTIKCNLIGMLNNVLSFLEGNKKERSPFNQLVAEKAYASVDEVIEVVKKLEDYLELKIQKKRAQWEKCLGQINLHYTKGQQLEYQLTAVATFLNGGQKFYLKSGNKWVYGFGQSGVKLQKQLKLHSVQLPIIGVYKKIIKSK